MRALLDTHALVWWMVTPERLSRRVHACIKDGDSQLFVSAASLYEIEYKRDRDRLLYRLPRDMLDVVPGLGFAWLNVEPGDTFGAARLESPHRDPWDRIIATQAGRQAMQLITADEVLTRACTDWRVQTFW